jgi:DNA-binding NtrC family response regulator
METLLVVDDDRILREHIVLALQEEYNVIQGSTKENAMEAVLKERPALALLDLCLPPKVATPEEGMEFVSWSRANSPNLFIIVMTGSRDKLLAYQAIEKGAYDYFRKPLDLTEVRIVIERALERRRIEIENQRLKRSLFEQYAVENIIGKSKEISHVVELARKVADTDISVFLTGETGTGKELVTRAIHAMSARSDAELVTLNCAAIPHDLIESELFGYERGAFTGAVTSKPGKLERAHGGTLFLDEIADLQLSAQAKLLRVIEEKKFERLGATKSLESDFRLITATNQDIRARIGQGSFREDLYFRINVVEIHLPALKERQSDIPVLAQHFASVYGKKMGRKVSGLSEEALSLLMGYSFPGNVRELENIIERAVALAQGDRITPAELPEAVHRDAGKVALTGGLKRLSGGVSLPGFLEQIERELLQEALEASSHRKSRAAELLGISGDNIKYLCKKYGIA